MASTKTLKERRQEAEEILDSIKKILNDAEKEVNKTKEHLNQASLSRKEFESLKPKIERTYKSAEVSIKRLRSERDRVNNLLSQVNKFYSTKYEPLTQKFNDRENGIAAKIRDGKKFTNQLNKLRTESKRQYTQIEKQIATLKSGLTELNRIEQTIKTMKKDIENNHSSSEQYISKIEAIFKRVEDSGAKIKLFEKEANENNTNVTSLLNSSQESFNSILSILEDAEGTLEKIKIIYEIASETGLGGEFDKRRIKLGEEIESWNTKILMTTTFLLAVIILLFIIELHAVDWIITNITFDANFYIRFFLTSPIIYYLIFVHRQYNRAKTLHEKYAFKTTLAFSLLAHIRTLTDREVFGIENNSKILNFILNGFYKIYDEPYYSQKPQKQNRRKQPQVQIDK